MRSISSVVLPTRYAFASRIFFTAASRISGSSLFSCMAESNADAVASGSSGCSSISAPAFRHSRPASPNSLRACMFSASVRISPVNPSPSFSKVVVILCERLAGLSSKAGTLRWPIMILPTPASIAFLKGAMSESKRASLVFRISGSEICESVEVSPCPGKCLAQLIR